MGVKDPTDLLSDDLQQSVHVMTLPPVVRTSDIPPGAGTTDSASYVSCFSADVP